MRSFVFCMALLTATTAAAQSPPRLEIGTRQGNYYWVVETAPDGSRRGGWVSVNVPLDAIDRNTLKPLPSVSALAAVETPTQAPPRHPASMNGWQESSRRWPGTKRFDRSRRQCALHRCRRSLSLVQT